MTERGEPTSGFGDAWQEYLTTVQELDAVRRDAAAVAAEQQETLRAAREELVAVRRRLTVQQARFAEVTGRHGVRLPTLTPGGAEVSAALGPDHGPAAALAALRRAQSTMEEADGELTALVELKRARPAHRASFRRNPAGYVSIALVIVTLSVGIGFGLFVLLR